MGDDLMSILLPRRPSKDGQEAASGRLIRPPIGDEVVQGHPFSLAVEATQGKCYRVAIAACQYAEEVRLTASWGPIPMGRLDLRGVALSRSWSLAAQRVCLVEIGGKAKLPMVLTAEVLCGAGPVLIGVAEEAEETRPPMPVPR